MSTLAPTSPDDELLPITEVERLTGIRQATLRMWEKRYGFPRPQRDCHGDRIYPLDQVEQLRAARRLMQQGVRPGKIFAGAARTELPSLPAASEAQALYRHPIALLRAYRVAELHSWYQDNIMRLGLRNCVIDCMAPLTLAVDAAWRQGDLPVRCVQLHAHLAASVLHVQLALARSSGIPADRPKAVLSTLTGNTHMLELVMAEAVLASLGVDCIQLGVDLAPQEVAAAAVDTGASIVGLWFGASFPGRGTARLVQALRGMLPPKATLWVGGTGTRHLPALPSGVQLVATLDTIEAALAGRP